jgi:hypothetical protein
MPAFKTLGDIADYVDRLIAERDARPSVPGKSADALAAAAPAKPNRARAGKKAGPSARQASKPASAANGASSMPSKASRGAKRSNGRTEKRGNGAGHTNNGAQSNGATPTKSERAAKRVRKAAGTPPGKPKRPSGGRAGTRTR